MKGGTTFIQLITLQVLYLLENFKNVSRSENALQQRTYWKQQYNKSCKSGSVTMLMMIFLFQENFSEKYLLTGNVSYYKILSETWVYHPITIMYVSTHNLKNIIVLRYVLNSLYINVNPSVAKTCNKFNSAHLKTTHTFFKMIEKNSNHDILIYILQTYNTKKKHIRYTCIPIQTI